MSGKMNDLHRIRMKRISVLLLVLIFVGGSVVNAQRKIDYVNPLIGTDIPFPEPAFLTV